MNTTTVITGSGRHFAAFENKNVFKTKTENQQDNKIAILLIGALFSFLAVLVILTVYH